MAGLVAACSQPATPDATIEVDKPVALVDEPVHIRITGLTPDEEVTVTAKPTPPQVPGSGG